jgi:CDP-diacylglycerol--serine O-phosphatidyltransferase
MKKHIPNFLTLMNLLCGCIALDYAFSGELEYVAYFVFVALVFDFLDGMVARLLHVHSEIGKQLDSLADVVSFGVLPGVIAFKLMDSALGRVYPEFHDDFLRGPLYLITFIIPLFSALRLAKFNIDTRQSESFIGMPTPANTTLWVSLPLILLHDNYNLSSIILNPIFLLILILLTSYLLVAEIPLFALKFKSMKWADNKIRFIFLGISAILIPIFLFTAIPIIIFLYIILSLLNNMKLIK